MYSLIRFSIMFIISVVMVHLSIHEFFPEGSFTNTEWLLGGFVAFVIVGLAEIKEAVEKIKEKK